MVSIGLIQINNSFSGQNYLPYSIACLESYLREHCKHRDVLSFLPHVYKRAPIGTIVSGMEKADIVGISTYVWNAQISLEVARRIKKKWPNKLIVFGGPQVPDQPEQFIREHDFIDIVVHNEGERTFNSIVELYPSRDWNELTGVSFIDSDGTFRASSPTSRMRNLSDLPSPFLNTIFDDLIAAHPKEKWIGLWETNRGCPFQCTFCDWGSATAAQVTRFEDERLEKELDWMAKKKIEYIFVCDANFGIKKRDIDIAKTVASVKEKTGFPQGFSVQNTKNATERAYQTQKIISDAGLNKGVALSMQSLDPHTLKNIKRDNISLESYFELARRFTRDKVETYSDLILPLPGETYNSFVKGVDLLIQAGQHNRIQFNNLSILPNAEMGSPDYIQEHGMEIVQTEIINAHGSKVVLEDDVPEYQELVVSTNSMSHDDWKKARGFAWMASFLHFDKLLQIPIILILNQTDIQFSEIVERFLYADRKQFPTISAIASFFDIEAEKISKGGPEYVFSEEWLSVYWPADEFIFIKLTVEDSMKKFYSEAEEILLDLTSKNKSDLPIEAITDAVRANSLLVSKPFPTEDVDCQLSYNVTEVWEKVKSGYEAALKKQDNRLRVTSTKYNYADLNQWCREVVWWGNKKGAYLYSGSEVSEELAGHH